MRGLAPPAMRCRMRCSLYASIWPPCAWRGYLEPETRAGHDKRECRGRRRRVCARRLDAALCACESLAAAAKHCDRRFCGAVWLCTSGGRCVLLLRLVTGDWLSTDAYRISLWNIQAADVLSRTRAVPAP